MSAILRLDWRGPQVAERVRQAAKDGVDQTMAAAVTVAQDRAPRDTGFMANTIETVQSAREEGDRIRGRWGNVTADYTIFQEVGARGRPGRYFLRGGADAEYPKLAGRIRAALR